MNGLHCAVRLAMVICQTEVFECVAVSALTLTNAPFTFSDEEVLQCSPSCLEHLVYGNR